MMRRASSIVEIAQHGCAQPHLSVEVQGADPRAPALLISRLVSWVDDLWCRAIGAGV
nr:OsmC family protein [Mycobacterium pseudoshottsii]